jgi:hypothetical protein
MPHEFWREVVDRVAAEVPGTLLLAEAFWLMEGYFVRTLGMHRVYNSAFMNMLRDEENAKYRSVIKNTLEFDPDIMKRYVNFMSNPDERTAIDQFGKGDKCFGVAAMMSTLPGLPMFGHGQIEGFTEKYGMEYRGRATTRLPTPGWSSATSARLRRCSSAAGSLPRAATFCSTTSSSERLGRRERLCLLQPQRRRARPGGLQQPLRHHARHHRLLRGLRRQGLRASCASSAREGLALSGDSGHRLAWRDSLTGLEYLRRANDLRSAASPSICTPTSATSFSIGASCTPRRSSPGTGSATSSTAAAFPTSTMRW